MKAKGLDDVIIVDNPPIALDIIRKRALTEIQEESLFICDLTDVIKKHRIWTQFLPRVIPFYAVKCNDSPMVLKILAALGTGFDCASKGEIKKVLDLGVPPSRIIYANPTKPNSHLSYAETSKVHMMTFDSEIELYKVKKLFPDAKLVLRIRCDAKKALCPLGEKFGCDPDIEAPTLINLAYELGLKMVGISFHVGSGCMDLSAYGRAIYTARKLFDYAARIGYYLTILDIGGGYPGDKGNNFVELSHSINAALDKYFPNDDVTIIAEPGRFYVSSAYTLACRIHSKREVVRDGKIINMMYFINDGVYGSFNCVLYDHQVPHPVPIENFKSEILPTSIWGPTCDALDQVCNDVLLPKMQIDDVLMFENMGAYTVPICSKFNGFPLPIVKYYLEKSYLAELLTLDGLNP
ncbi:Ornithine decarboxylase 1 [Pseudolycoriella hygida]|uniref:ornithine decarboxylase n=1 Tax=Pseudolycoriella hygida TaxID=35572 RepID=A0A9Q0NBJ1_9DIPT|nr:Ornithine decarboxylase 1 [Pseudolycoriella hygida]